jgi:hypothetical protein
MGYTLTRKATDIAETEAYLLKLPRAPSAAPRGWPWVTGTMQEKLEEWREKEATDAFKNAVWFNPRPKLVLPDKILKVLVKMNVACQTERIVQHFFPDLKRSARYQDGIPQIETVRAPVTPKYRTPERRPISISRPIRTYPNEKYCTPRSQIRPHRNGATNALNQRVQLTKFIETS